MRFGRVDVTEAQFSVITVMLLTVLIGPGFWDTEVRTPERTLLQRMDHLAQFHIAFIKKKTKS